jgi:hypothetical protein
MDNLQIVSAGCDRDTMVALISINAGGVQTPSDW